MRKLPWNIQQISLILLGLLLAGCAGNPARDAALQAGPAVLSEDTVQPGTPAEGSGFGVPFPTAPDGSFRAGSSPVFSTQLGSDAYQRNPNAVPVSTTMEFAAPSAELSWAIYRLGQLLDWEQPQDIVLDFDQMPELYYAAIADYGHGVWQWQRRGSSQGASGNIDTIPWPAATDGITTQGFVYVAVLFHDDTSGVLNGLQLNWDNPGTGPLVGLDASPLGGNAPVGVSFTANFSDGNGGNAALFEWDWEGDGIYDELSTANTMLHTYTEIGDYFPTVRATDDNDGLTEREGTALSVRGWTHSIGGANLEQFNSAAANAEGCVLAGLTATDTASGEGFVVRYDQKGQLLWQRSWGGTEFDAFEDVAINSGGEIIVAGETYSLSAGSAVILLKLSADGELIWSRSWDSAGTDFPTVLGTDENDNIWVVGQTGAADFGSGTSSFLLKFNSDGELLLTKGIVNSDWVQLRDLVVVSDGSLLAVGNSRAYAPGLETLIMLDLNGSGEVTGEAALDWPYSTFGSGISFTPGQGEIYVCGSYVDGFDTQAVFASVASDRSFSWLTTAGSGSGGGVRRLATRSSFGLVSDIYGVGVEFSFPNDGLIFHLAPDGSGIGGCAVAGAADVDLYDIAAGSGGSFLIAGTGASAPVSFVASGINYAPQVGFSNHTGTCTTAEITASLGQPVIPLVSVSLTADSGGGGYDGWAGNLFPPDL
ncbi:MAG: hypothetical protein R3F46_12095 [bacterium]